MIGQISFADLTLFIRDLYSPCHAFVKSAMNPCSPALFSDEQMIRYSQKKRFDAFVVGSDQVWRPKYSPNILNYFLDFVEGHVIKLSYAASFGVDSWEFTPEQTTRCKQLISRFQGVSVREKSGIQLCADYLGCTKAEWVLDPTMLLTRASYRSLLAAKNLPNQLSDCVLSYILDLSASKEAILQSVLDYFHYPLYQANQGLQQLSTQHIAGKATIEEWLLGFEKAKFAVVDSFHGCVFSILFHVPFIVIANKERGLTRFDSLLSLFGLEKRLISSPEDFSEAVLLQPIDWVSVDAILESERKKSISFLQRYLNI